MIFLLCISAVLASFNTQYVTDQLEIQQTNLNSSKSYQLSLIITQLPSNNYCLPLLQVIINNQTHNDSLAYSIKANIQKCISIPLITSLSKLVVQCQSTFKIKNINKTMHFNLTLTEAKQHISPPCQFPHYGQNCSLSIQQIQKEFSVTILILNNTWFYAYTILDNDDYEIYVQNGDSLFGISIISFNKVNVTRLPSFLQNFIVLDSYSDENQILLPKQKIVKKVFILLACTISIPLKFRKLQSQLQLLIKNEEFPFWATILLISIVIFGLLLFLIILCHYKRQYKKLTQIKPALDRKVLKKYMPPQKVDSKMSADTCSVCLVQFELKEKYCKTPCNHYFHEQCLLDWTTKQANCPVCRQGLLENEINELMEVKNNRNRQVQELNIQEIQEAIKSKDEPPSQTYRDLPFLQLSSSPFRTQCKIELDCSPQAEHSPQIIQFDGSPQNLTNRNLCFQSDGIVESQN